MKLSISGSSLLVGTIVLLAGCNKKTDQFDHDWTLPIKITDSVDSLAGGVRLYRCLHTPVALQSLKDESLGCFIMERNAGNSNSWMEVPVPGVPHGYSFPPTLEQASGRMLFTQGLTDMQKNYTGSDHFMVNALFVRMTESGEVQVEAKRKWTEDKKTLFRDADQNVQLNYPCIGVGVINDSDVYLPYSIMGQTVTHRGKSILTEDGSSDTGVFHSTDSGVTWQMEQIADFQAYDPSVCKTKNFYYFFTPRGVTLGYELWFSRKPTGGASWDTPKSVTKTFAKELGNYTAVADGDTVHMCWMDHRHNKWRFDLSGPAIENDDIYYSHRKDSDSRWSKDIVLSKGVLYCYAPSMSVEGDKIVVAWAGIPNAGKYHTDYDPNDIFYVTSKDGGNTWAKPLKVTDGAKDGMTAGHPQVMLLNGVIHLFYIQGKMNLQQVGGLTKLNQPPWPIYYTQRPFPD